MITSAYSSKATTCKVWLNIQVIFCDKKDSNALPLESELHSIPMGDLSVQDYCTRVKKFVDLLEGLGEKVKEKHVVIHVLNILPSKCDNIMSIIHHTKLFLAFTEICFMLVVEEQCLPMNRPPNPSHENHASSPSLLHIGNTPPHGGGSNNIVRMTAVETTIAITSTASLPPVINSRRNKGKSITDC